MKRSDMVKLSSDYLALGDGSCFSDEDYLDMGDDLLSKLEKAGMKPPGLGGDESQALMRVYVCPNFNMWEEDFHEDEKVAEAFKKIMMREKR